MKKAPCHDLPSWQAPVRIALSQIQEIRTSLAYNWQTLPIELMQQLDLLRCSNRQYTSRTPEP